MPSRTLPTFVKSEVVSRNSSKSCYVTMGTRVFDITDFLDSHPGGADIILEYGGKDITDILKDEASHAHSEAAYEVLEDSLIGFLAIDSMAENLAKDNPPQNSPAQGTAQVKLNELEANDIAYNESSQVYARTGLASAEDLSKETDAATDYKVHKFLDLNKPLIIQVWFGGFSKEFYLEQVHRPRHFKGGESAPLFGNILEPLTKTPWYMVPILWLPPVAYGTLIAREGCSSWLYVAAYWFFGLFLWTLVEYILHRFLFHLDRSGTLLL
jgi:4-hydroxysphinganine ceramide fatty acyl 2-hydroxylase